MDPNLPAECPIDDVVVRLNLMAMVICIIQNWGCAIRRRLVIEFAGGIIYLNWYFLVILCLSLSWFLVLRIRMASERQPHMACSRVYESIYYHFNL